MARWNSCNVLQTAPEARRLWQFDAKGGGFALSRENSGQPDAALPGRTVNKTWSSLWQPKLNVAWLPPESVFFRVAQFPKSSFDETLSMVEFQLEKLSPIPVTQIVWTLHVMPQTSGDLQTVVVVIAARSAVEDYLGKLEARGYLADRLEAPMLDLLESITATEDGAWIYPGAFGSQETAMVAWWYGDTLRNLSRVVLSPANVRGLKESLAQLCWAGEMEGWLTAPPHWHLVADAAVATLWEPALHEALEEIVAVVQPPRIVELAARTASRAAAANLRANLLPAEFSARYRQQFVDRLWLRGLVTAGLLYAAGVVVYLCATGVQGYRTRAVEQQVADLSGSYTNVLLLKARYEILKDRQDLKYAALDCWKIVAEQLPQGVSLQRFSFSNGQKLSLNGTASPSDVNTLFDFNTAIQKAKVNGRAEFDPQHGDPINPHPVSATVETWNMSLQLSRGEESP